MADYSLRMTHHGHHDGDTGCVEAKLVDVGWLPAGLAVVSIWLWELVGRGPVAALELSWMLAIGAPFVACALFMRLRITPTHLSRTVGPWRRSVTLASLDSITWRSHPSRGIIYVRDREGGVVPIYVARFTRIDEWGQLLLSAAARSGATVDSESRALLEGAGAARSRPRRTPV